MADSERLLLVDALPELAAEMVRALTSEAEPDLAAQVPSIVIAGRCGCGDSFCSSFYTGPRPVAGWSAEGTHRNHLLDVDRGMVVLDVVNDVIRYVEVLDRPEIKAPVDAFPEAPLRST